MRETTQLNSFERRSFIKVVLVTKPVRLSINPFLINHRRHRLVGCGFVPKWDTLWSTFDWSDRVSFQEYGCSFRLLGFSSVYCHFVKMLWKEKIWKFQIKRHLKPLRIISLLIIPFSFYKENRLLVNSTNNGFNYHCWCN